MASSSALQILQHGSRHGLPVGGHQSEVGGSIIHNVACSAAQPSSYRIHVKWQIVFHRHRTLCRFGASLFSKQGRPPCCILESCSRSSHSACARMALITDFMAECHFSSGKRPESQIRILRIHKMEGAGMLSNNRAKCPGSN